MNSPTPTVTNLSASTSRVHGYPDTPSAKSEEAREMGGFPADVTHKKIHTNPNLQDEVVTEIDTAKTMNNCQGAGKLDLKKQEVDTMTSDDTYHDNDKRHGAFARHLHDVLSTNKFPDVIWWNEKDGGQSFCLRPKEFSREVMVTLFRGKKFGSFTRKLNRWGFFRVHDEHSKNSGVCVYKHKAFQMNSHTEQLLNMVPRSRHMERHRAKQLKQCLKEQQEQAKKQQVEQPRTSTVETALTNSVPIHSASLGLAAPQWPPRSDITRGLWSLPIQMPQSEYGHNLLAKRGENLGLSNNTPLAALALLEKQTLASSRRTTPIAGGIASLLKGTTSPIAPRGLASSNAPIR